MAAGLVGVLFYAAFGDFQCKSCGKIAKREFPPEARTRMMIGSLVMVVVAIIIGALCVWLIPQQK
jgi:uncharacterized membrane protein SpoIIM required for sporulation